MSYKQTQKLKKRVNATLTANPVAAPKKPVFRDITDTPEYNSWLHEKQPAFDEVTINHRIAALQSAPKHIF